MSTAALRVDRAKNGTPFAMIPEYQEILERILAFADTAGAAYAEAFQHSGTALADAYQEWARKIGTLQKNLAGQNPADWQAALTSAGAPGDHFAAAQECALAIADNLSEMTRTIGLAFLDASTGATLAALKAQEELGAESPVDVIKVTAAARASLARKVSEATADTVRQFVA